MGKLASTLILYVVVILMAPKVALSGPGVDQEDGWSYIGTSKEGVRVSYLPDRIIKHRKLIQAWFKGEHPDSDNKISSNISLHEFNYFKGTYRLLQGTLFFRDGSARTSNH